MKIKINHQSPSAENFPVNKTGNNKKEDAKKTLGSPDIYYTLLIRPHGYRPRSGLLLCQYLTEKIPSFKKSARLLDIGTGENALVAIHAAKLGLKNIVAIDPDLTAYTWAKKNIRYNGLEDIISIYKKPIDRYCSREKFNLIVSNPPQMPVPKNMSKHDDGDRDGRLYVNQIIEFASASLKSDGLLILNVFDFLGVDKDSQNRLSLFSIMKKYGLKPKIVFKTPKIIKHNSHTFKNLSWINKMYPDYFFKKDRDGLNKHYIYTIEAIKIKR